MPKREWICQGKQLADQIETTELSGAELALWNLGQCGYAVKTGNQVLLIDPVLNDMKDAQGNTRRMYPPACDPEDLHADIVFCTHGHRDHMALPTLQGLYKNNPDLKIVIPAGLEEELLEAGIPESNIVPVNAKETISLGMDRDQNRLRFYGIQTAHPELVKDEKNRDVSLAYVLEMPGFKILHPGDTYLCDQLIEDFKNAGPVDVFFPPVNGQDYFRTARGCIGNFSPYEAAMAAGIVKAGLVIPTHYDMVQGNTCSVWPFMEIMEEMHPTIRTSAPRIGERIILKR